MSKPLDNETYLSIRKAYDDAELEVSGRYDKWLLTLSGGALGLSITFIEKISKNPTKDTFIWLLISWGFLVCSLLFTLLSLITSQSAIRENRKELESVYYEENTEEHSSPKWFTRLTNLLNWSSLFLFILGVAFLCIFSFINIDNNIANGGVKNGKETTTSSRQGASNGKGKTGIRPTAATSSTKGRARICSPASPTKKERR